MQQQQQQQVPGACSDGASMMIVVATAWCRQVKRTCGFFGHVLMQTGHREKNSRMMSEVDSTHLFEPVILKPRNWLNLFYYEKDR